MVLVALGQVVLAQVLYRMPSAWWTLCRVAAVVRCQTQSAATTPSTSWHRGSPAWELARAHGLGLPVGSHPCLEPLRA